MFAVPLKDFGRQFTVEAKAPLQLPDLDIRVALAGSMTGLVTFAFPTHPEQGTHMEFIFGQGAFELDSNAPPGFGLWPRKGL